MLGATNVADSIQQSPRATPSRRKSRRKSLDPRQTPNGWSYICDAAGDVIENKEGHEVLDYAYSIAWNIS